MDLSQLSDSELMQYVGSSDSGDLSSIPDNELLQLAGIDESAEPKSFLPATWEGIKNAPGAVVDMITSVPSGISNIISSLFSPEQSIADGTAEKTVRGIGTLAAGTAGAGTGALAGAPLAPFTLGLSVPVGAALGGASGLLGFDWLNELTGADAPTTAEQKIERLGENTGTGLALGAASKAIEGTARSAAESFPKIANALDRKSLGTRQSDYGKASETRTITTPTGEIESFVKSNLDDLLENNKLGSSRDPSVLLNKINEAEAPLRTVVNDAINNFDKTAGISAVPNFSESIKFITSGKIPADQLPTYVNRLLEIENGIKNQGQGSLRFLQEQKKAFGESWDPADKVKSGFDRAIYNDLKTSIEGYVPEVKAANIEMSKYETARPIVTRALRAAENESTLTKLSRLGFTTGGVGAPAIVGSMLGGPAGAAVGGAIGLTGKALATPKGQAVAANLLRGSAKVAKPISSVMEALFAPAVGAIEATNSNAKSKENSTPAVAIPQSAIESLFATGEKPMPSTKQEIKEVEAEIDKDPYWSTKYEIESGRNPNAVTPIDPKTGKRISSAKGAFQLLDATAKALKVKDPFNIRENFEGAKALDIDNIKVIKAATNVDISDDPKMRYAAHYLGAPVTVKLITGIPLTDKEQKQVRELKEKILPKFSKIYASKSEDTSLV